MRRRYYSFAFHTSLALTLISSLLYAKEKRAPKHAPLPMKVMTAKSVYLDNQSGYANIGDKAYNELSKWGRFEIVGNPKDADLVILLSATEYVGGYVTSGTVEAQGTTYDYGNGVASTEVNGHIESNTTPVVMRRTYFTIIDPKNGAPLWSNSMPWGRPVAYLPYSAWRSATRGLIKELRNRVQEQEDSSSSR